MATTYTSVFLSGSSSGLLIGSTGSTSLSNTLHTCGSATLVQDEVHIYAVNNSTADRKATIEFGNTATGNNISAIIPATSGIYVIVPGLRTGQGRIISAFTSSATLLDFSFGGHVNRITATA